MKSWKNLASRILATPCLVCLAVPALRRGFCAACEEELPWQPPGCHVCGVAMPAPFKELRCLRCSLQPPAFDRCHCTFAYESPVSAMLRRFKDRAGFPEFRALSNCFIEHFLHYHEDIAAPWPDLLLPVPLHATRIRTRGFNQALLLARQLSRRTGIPVLEDSCRRQHSGARQRGLNAEQRQQNMKGIFSPQPCAALTTGKRLAIVDDVVTTTATAHAMATAIAHCGATCIDVWALARSNNQHAS